MRSHWNRRVRFAGFALALGFGIGFGLEADAQTEAITPELVDGIFHAYREGPPRAPGIEIGMKIDRDNAEVVRDLLPKPILDQLRAGKFEITVGKTTSVPPPPEYIEATKRYAGQVRLLPDGNLDYASYVAGLPFPVIREDDPRAGLKLAWNHRYYYFGETNQDWSYWKYVNKNGDVERELVADFRIMYWKHRTAFPASKSCPECDIEDERTLPHPSDMWRADYLRFTSPFDVANFQFLQHRYEDDRIEDQNWFYLPNLRRVRLPGQGLPRRLGVSGRAGDVGARLHERGEASEWGPPGRLPLRHLGAAPRTPARRHPGESQASLRPTPDRHGQADNGHHPDELRVGP